MANPDKKVYIVIPAYNEAAVIESVINEIKNAGYGNIIVVDDGSSDDTYAIIKKIPGIIALRHRINRGQGATVRTAMEAAKLLSADIIVTMDADGQHDVNDVKNLIKPILNNECDVVLGIRRKNRENMPLSRKFYNLISNIITWYFCGLWVSDSQSGLRAYSKYAASKIDNKSDKYEYSSEIIREIYKHKLRFKEVEIHTKYTEYSKGKVHQQGLINGFKTLYKIIMKILS